MRRIRSIGGGLLLLMLLQFLLVRPVAASEIIAPSADPTGKPIALASTGLDITVPVIIGLTTLVVGIAFVSWAFLRGGSARRRHH